MSRPPRYEPGEEPEYEEGEEQYQQDEENAGEGDEEQEQHEEGEERAESPASAGSDVQEYIPAPTEKEFPPHYVLDVGASGFDSRSPSSIQQQQQVNANTAASAAAGGAGAQQQNVEGNTRKLIVPFDDVRIPKWLHYVLNDDFPSLSYLIHPPPGAEINLPPTGGEDSKNNKNKKKKRGGGGDSEDSYEEGSEYSEMSRPTSSRGGASEGDDSQTGGSRRHGGGSQQMEETPFHPNERFILVPSLEKPSTEWNLFAWDPPVKKSKNKNSKKRPGSAGSQDEDGTGSQYGGSEGGGGGGGRSENASEYDEERLEGFQSGGGGGGGDDNETVIDEFGLEKGQYCVDALTLASMFSPQCLLMMIKERRPLLTHDLPPKPMVESDEQTGEEGEELLMRELNDDELDEETLAARKRRAPPALQTLWRWCEAYGGIYTDSACYPLVQWIRACTKFQDAQEEEMPKPVKKAKKMVIDVETGEEMEADPEPGEEEYDEVAAALEEEERAREAEMTFAQKRRSFFDYTALFDKIILAPSTRQAQLLERTMRMMITEGNIAPTKPIELHDRKLAPPKLSEYQQQQMQLQLQQQGTNNQQDQNNQQQRTISSPALRNLNSLHAYLTFMECVPRSLVVSSWTEPQPLTEAEITAYPEGFENVPEEHPAKLPPLLWKLIQQIRRRRAKQARNHSAPLRTLKETVAALFTPPRDENSAEEDPAPVPIIHSHPETIDPVLTEFFDAGRNYPPNKLRVYVSDVALIALSRDDFASDAFEWLGEMKKNYPHPKWHPVSSSHLLAFSLGRMSDCCADVTVARLLDPRWFFPLSRIDYQTFITEVCSDPEIRPLDTKQMRRQDLLDNFSKIYSRVFLEKLDELEERQQQQAKEEKEMMKRNTLNNNAELGSQISSKATSSQQAQSQSSQQAQILAFVDSMKLLEQECSELHSRLVEIKKKQEEFQKEMGLLENNNDQEGNNKKNKKKEAELNLPTFSSNNSAMLAIEREEKEKVQKNRMNEFEKEIGTTALATPQNLRLAVDNNRFAVITWLVERGVGKVDHERGEIPVLEYCVETKNANALLHLVQTAYADMNASMEGGTRTILTAAQVAFKKSIVEQIEAAMKESRRARGSDPTQALGVKLGSIV